MQILCCEVYSFHDKMRQNALVGRASPKLAGELTVLALAGLRKGIERKQLGRKQESRGGLGGSLEGIGLHLSPNMIDCSVAILNSRAGKGPGIFTEQHLIEFKSDPGKIVNFEGTRRARPILDRFLERETISKLPLCLAIKRVTSRVGHPWLYSPCR